MSVAVYFSAGINLETIRPVLALYAIGAQEFSPAFSNDPSPKVLIVDREFLETQNSSLLKQATAVLLLLDEENDLERIQLPEDLLMDHCIKQIQPRKLQNLIQSVLLIQQVQTTRQERDAHLRRLRELNNIGIALSAERDPVRLLNMILQKSREITCSDAGSLYLVEGDEETGKRLRFKISQCDSMTVNYEESVMPMTKGSIAGYAAATGESLNIPDAYLIGPDQEYKFNRHFDESTGYRTTSILAVPMRNHKGEIIGVIQLINRKTTFKAKLTRENYLYVTQAYDQNDEELVSSLASQAAVALENNILIKSIQTLFEGFVTASVTAIESRDPTTSGHSFRVSDLTVGLAELVDKLDSGKFSTVSFTRDEIKEIRYAALLHDFGKVGVRENVLVKAKKLYPLQIDLIKERFAYFIKAWEAEFYRSKLNLLLTQGPQEFGSQGPELDNIFKNRLNTLEGYLNFIVQSNEPTVLPEGNFEKLLRIASERDLIPPGAEEPMLTADEVQLLSIRKGSLNDRERIEIESHVTHTFLFLSKIPWTSELKRVPRIAYGHHEKLNGAGYPNRIRASDIPIQTRMMTISDIYDALTASDRPYKRAVPTEKALDIIGSEVKQQQIDPDLFDLFVEGKIYRLTVPK